MRTLRVGLTVLMLLAVPASTRADPTFEAAVSAVTIPHTFDARLHDIAHQRAVEIVTDFSHAGMRPGTAEVLAWSSGKPDPLGWVVTAWLNSPVHRAVLTDSSYELMGCATYSVADATYAACVLSAAPIYEPGLAGRPSNVGGTESTPLPAPTPPVPMLPDAAMRTP